ncbi:MAG: hypothetical protein QM705_02770 [Ancrocorticia sp.]
MIRMVPFDRDGVIRHFDAEYVAVIEQCHGLSQGVLEEVAFSP